MACSPFFASHAVGKRLETFLRYKFCLGAYGTNNHKLFGSRLHLWLRILCSQRAEGFPVKFGCALFVCRRGKELD